MGEVIVVYKILPRPEKLEDIKKALGSLKIERIEERPVAFGLRELIVTAIIPDEGGSQDRFENQLQAIDGCENIEALRVSRRM